MDGELDHSKETTCTGEFIYLVYGKIKSDRQRSNMRFGMSVSMFRLNIIGMTPVVVLVM